MDWDDIKLLIAVERAGTFSGAATALGINTATVSRRIAALEQVARTRIFRRTTTGSTLTASGAQLLHRALKVEGEVVEFERVLRGLHQHAPRQISVQASEGVITYLLTPLIARQAWGPLGIAGDRLNIDLPPIRPVPLGATERPDIRLIWATPETMPSARPDDRVRKVAEVMFAPYFSQAYAAATHPSLERFEDLSRHRLLTLEQYDWFPSEASLGSWNRMVRSVQAGATSANNSAILGLMTVNGGGISLLPTYSEMYSDLLRRLEIKMPSMQADLWLVSGGEDLKDPVVRSCYDGLGKAFAAFDWKRA